jgi:hypothetical protein
MGLGGSTDVETTSSNIGCCAGVPAGAYLENSGGDALKMLPSAPAKKMV